MSFTVLLLVVFLVLAFVLGEAIKRVYVNRLSDELVVQAQVTAYAIHLTKPERSSATELSALIEKLGVRGDTRLTLIDVDGDVIADTMSDPSAMENHKDRPEVLDAHMKGSGRSTHASRTDDESYLCVAVPVPEGDGWILRSAVPLEDVEAAVGAMQRTVLLALFFGGGVSAIALWWLAGRIVRPMESLRVQANRVGAGDLSARVAPVDLSEIDEVGQAFKYDDVCSRAIAGCAGTRDIAT